jgi:hypothetical protein
MGFSSAFWSTGLVLPESQASCVTILSSSLITLLQGGRGIRTSRVLRYHVAHRPCRNCTSVAESLSVHEDELFALLLLPLETNFATSGFISPSVSIYCCSTFWTWRHIAPHSFSPISADRCSRNCHTSSILNVASRCSAHFFASPHIYIRQRWDSDGLGVNLCLLVLKPSSRTISSA